METAPDLKQGDQVIIFQHPKGRPKEFSSDKILGVEKPFVRYQADTDKGSSGSPVVTTTGLKLIAVHHGGSNKLGYNKGTLCSEILVHLRTGTCKWHISCLSFIDSKLQERIQEFLKGGYTIDVTFITNGVEGERRPRSSGAIS